MSSGTFVIDIARNRYDSAELCQNARAVAARNVTAVG
jgi:hypothetical protein